MQRSILVIDDEPALLALAEMFLSELNYATLPATSGHAAVRLLLEDPSGPAAVLLDMTMPGMPPTDTFRHIREISPALPVIVLSGQSEDYVREHFAAGTIAGYLQKPYTEVELEQALKAALAFENPSPSALFKLKSFSDNERMELADEFLAARRLDFPVMMQLLAASDFERLRIMGHTLKGSGGCFGFIELTQLGSALEHFAHVSDAASCQEQLSRLEVCLEKLTQ